MKTVLGWGTQRSLSSSPHPSSSPRPPPSSSSPSRPRPLHPNLTKAYSTGEGKKRLHLSILYPLTEKPSGTVIFLHGLGDTGEGWYPVFEMLQPRLPHVKVILPTALDSPTRPVTVNGGMVMPAWYDIATLSDEDRLAIECEGLDETKKQIRKIIKDEIESGTPSNRIIIGGFSQGGAAALHVAYSFEKPLAGVMALSAYLPLQHQLKQQLEEANYANRGTELLMCHGSDDSVVLEVWGRKSYEILRDTMGVTGRFVVYPGMEHSSSPQELADILAFIQRKLPQEEDESNPRAKL